MRMAQTTTCNHLFLNQLKNKPSLWLAHLGQPLHLLRKCRLAGQLTFGLAWAVRLGCTWLLGLAYSWLGSFNVQRLM